jgi:hypothetical protein
MNPYKYPFKDLIGLPITDNNYSQKLTSLINANNELRTAGMTLGSPNIFVATTTDFNTSKFVFDNFRFSDGNSLPTEDGLYFADNPPNYFIIKDGINKIVTVESIRTPRSQDELTAWNNFIAFKQSSISFEKLFKDPILLASKNINSDINVNFNMAFVNNPYNTSSPYTYPIIAVSPENISKQANGTYFYLTDDNKNPKTYYFSTGSGSPSVVPASDISLFIKNPSDIEFQSWRTQYAEKQIQLTQRSTEFQAFLNTTVAEFNTYSDLFTNVLKTIFTSLRDIASRL